MPADTQVGHTIANIGALVGGIFAPHHVAESNEQDSEVTGSDSVVDDDNIISLTVSSISPSSGSIESDQILRENLHYVVYFI